MLSVGFNESRQLNISPSRFDGERTELLCQSVDTELHFSVTLEIKLRFPGFRAC